MTKKICFLLFVLLSMQGYAQTGIGTTTPHASAKLDVSATNKGFLPPRVTLTGTSDVTTIPGPAEGLLVYNLGSVGLQAGYYYWNSANWVTIATTSLAGNTVVAGDLVKLYSQAYSNATGKIANATSGYSFTVPVSGRYLFDFTSTGYANSSDFTFTFKVRQGTTDIGTDAQTSANNTVHVEYNGKVEVNLQAGTNYNVNIISTGIRNSSDYDRVYYKMVAGNLPVNQHMADRNIQLNNNYLSNDGDNEGIRVDNSGNVGIGTASPTAKLDVAGNINVTGKINVTDPSGNIVTKAAGFVGRGVDVTLGNLKARFAASGNMSLQVSSVSGSYTTRGSDQYITNGSASTTIAISITTTPTYIWPDGINFVGAGNSETCLIYDTSAGMTWRIIGLVGPGYLNNFISIERIL